MTTAEVFADYLGLTPENAPWAWTNAECERCNGLGHIRVCVHGSVFCNEKCPKCKGAKYDPPTLTATSPLAPEPTPGWLYVMAKHHSFSRVIRHDATDYQGVAWMAGMGQHADDSDPIHAAARALIAADPTLREACERASDYEKEMSA